MNKRQPVILGFVSDLMLETRIAEVAQKAGFQLEWVGDADQVAAPGQPSGEHLVEPGVQLIDKLSDLQPALILFDLGNDDIPWQEWLQLIKTSPATRRIPVVCFGSQVQVEAMKAARAHGAEAVLARGRIFLDLPELIQKYVRLPDYAALEDACRRSLPALALRGLRLFNAGEYFEAHEVLEEAWNADQTAGRELYRAVLQVAVAYLQIERGNYSGAVKMFQRLHRWIDPLPDECQGIDIAALRQDARAAYAHLTALGPERLAEFDRRLLKPVIYKS